MSQKDKIIIDSHRGVAIFNFCEALHDDIDELYELMIDGSNEEEKEHIEQIIAKLKELNLDRE